jgi:hypothetical protein
VDEVSLIGEKDRWKKKCGVWQGINVTIPA